MLPGSCVECLRASPAVSARSSWSLPLRLSPSAQRFQRWFSDTSSLTRLRRAFEVNPAILDDDLDPIVGNRQLRFQGCDSISRNIGVGALVDRRQPNFDVVRDRENSSDPLRGGLGLKLVRVTVGETRQRNNAIFDGDGNVIGIKVGIPSQLVPYIAFYFDVGFHGWLLVCAKGIGGLGRWYRRMVSPIADETYGR